MQSADLGRMLRTPDYKGRPLQEVFNPVRRRLFSPEPEVRIYKNPLEMIFGESDFIKVKQELQKAQADQNFNQCPNTNDILIFQFEDIEPLADIPPRRRDHQLWNSYQLTSPVFRDEFTHTFRWKVGECDSHEAIMPIPQDRQSTPNRIAPPPNPPKEEACIDDPR